MTFPKTLIAAIATALAVAPVAAAHVEITPEKVPPDTFVVFTLEVPAELKVPTVKLEVKAPLDRLSAVKKPSWKAVVRGGIVTWSGGKIAPGRSTRFRLGGHTPKTSDGELVFPTLQTYADGTVVHWIGPPSSDEPAPRVMLESELAPVPVATIPLSEKGNHHGLWLAAGIAVVGVGLALVGVAAARRRRA